MKNLRRVILIILILVSTVLIYGCGTKENVKGIDKVAESPTPTVAPTPTPTPTPVPTPTPIPTNRPEAKIKVPILYYHRVNDNIDGIEELHVKPAEFEKQMKYLKDNNYTIVDFDDLDKVEHIKNPIIITFDDGYEDNYTYAYPVLKKYGFKATIFIPADFIGGGSMITKEQMKEMGDLISFQSHTLTHAELTKVTPEVAEKELSESKKKIEAITGKPVNVVAYPVGFYNQKVLEITKKYYKYAVLNKGPIYTTGDNLLEIKRVYIPRWLDMAGFTARIKG